MSKSRYRISRRNRAVIGGLIIALGSIYALAVSYNIPGAELLWFLVGSALVLLAAMLAALILVLMVKGLGLMWRRLLPGIESSDDAGGKRAKISRKNIGSDGGNDP